VPPRSAAPGVRPQGSLLIQVIRSGYHTLSALAGTRLQEFRWARRGPAAVRRGFDNLTHPHRRLIVEHVSALAPWAGILEVGCGYGPNLYHLAQRFPHAVLRGIDINRHSVALGNARLQEAGLANVRLVAGRADDLRQFAGGAFDIVLTNALLMYVGPDRIDRAVAEMLRVARRYLVLVEQHRQDDESRGAGRFESGLWRRNYAVLLQRLAPDDRVEIRKVPVELWDDEGWREYGCIITSARVAR
jgi:SAM-dependent methyltransferase